MKLNGFLQAACLLAGVFVLGACGKVEPGGGEQKEEVIPGTVERISLYSGEYNRQLVASVWLPPGFDAGRTYPFLYLLHGYGDDNDSWIQKGNASIIADNYYHEQGVPMVIVMPNGLTAFYQGPYETFFYETLMPAVEEKYHCNGKRALAGLSMGGYGSLYHALKYPEKYTYSYAMSPAADLNAFQAYAVAHDPDDYPPITVESGTEDYTVGIAGVRELVAMLQSSGLRCAFIERPGGHDWGFWPVCLTKALVKVGESFK